MSLETVKLMLEAKKDIREQQSFGVCLSGNCKGCHLVSVCDQPCPFIDGHLDDWIEATGIQIKNMVSELKCHMEMKGYKNLKDIRGTLEDGTGTRVLSYWLRGVL